MLRLLISMGSAAVVGAVTTNTNAIFLQGLTIFIGICALVLTRVISASDAEKKKGRIYNIAVTILCALVTGVFTFE